MAERKYFRLPGGYTTDLEGRQEEQVVRLKRDVLGAVMELGLVRDGDRELGRLSSRTEAATLSVSNGEIALELKKSFPNDLSEAYETVTVDLSSSARDQASYPEERAQEIVDTFLSCWQALADGVAPKVIAETAVRCLPSTNRGGHCMNFWCWQNIIRGTCFKKILNCRSQNL